MRHFGLTLVVTTLAICCIQHVFGASSSSSVSISGDNNPTKQTYSVVGNVENKKKKCTQTVTVAGNGVLDVFPLSCKNTEAIKAGTDKFALYKNPKERIAFFSNTPSTLMVIEGNKCTKRTYTSTKKSTSHKKTAITKKECKKVKKEMEKAEQEWKKHSKEQSKKT